MFIGRRRRRYIGLGVLCLSACTAIHLWVFPVDSVVAVQMVTMDRSSATAPRPPRSKRTVTYGWNSWLTIRDADSNQASTVIDSGRCFTNTMASLGFLVFGLIACRRLAAPRISRRRCDLCGYSLEHIQSDFCPECGNPRHYIDLG